MLPVLKRGVKGDAVRLMKALMKYGDTGGAFDAALEEFVKRWQEDRGLAADGVVGRQSWQRLLQDSLGIEPQEDAPRRGVKPLDFKQYDPRWAGVVYSSHGDAKQTIKTSGCGPTAMADIVAAAKDETATPPALAQKAVAWGDRTYRSGTAWRFFEHAAKEYGFGSFEKSAALNRLQSCLDGGGWAVASMGKGYWTKGGHYICVWKIKDGWVYAHDPASSKRTRQRTEQFMKERKMFFLFKE